jgi:hypothetical protein
MTRTETGQDLRDHLDRIFKFWLDRALEEAASSEVEEGIERRFIHDWYNGLEAHRDTFKAKYKNQIRQNDQWYPRKWMEEDIRISALMKRYPRIVDILNAIEARKSESDNSYIYLLHPKYDRFEKEYPHGWTYKNEHLYALFITDSRFYETILTSLEIEKITLQKYLQAFHKTGILKKLPNTGKYKNLPIYAVGYFSKYKEDKFKLNRFLTSDNKDALKEFILYDTGISNKLANTAEKQENVELVYSKEVYSSQRRDIEQSVKYRRRQ